MERRTFTFGLGALIAAPALPVSAAATSATAGLSQHFAKAKLLARCHDQASPEMLKRLMKLDNQTAQGVFNLLKDQNVIAKGLDGIVRSVNPLNVNCVPNEAIRARNLAQISAPLKEQAQKLVRKTLEETAKVEDQPLDKQENSTQDRQITASEPE